MRSDGTTGAPFLSLALTVNVVVVDVAVAILLVLLLPSNKQYKLNVLYVYQQISCSPGPSSFEQLGNWERQSERAKKRQNESESRKKQ